MVLFSLEENQQVSALIILLILFKEHTTLPPQIIFRKKSRTACSQTADVNRRSFTYLQGSKTVKAATSTLCTLCPINMLQMLQCHLRFIIITRHVSMANFPLYEICRSFFSITKVIKMTCQITAQFPYCLFSQKGSRS